MMGKQFILCTALMFAAVYGQADLSAMPDSTAPARATSWVPYQSDTLHFQLKIPSDWTVRAADKAVGFASPDQPAGGHGALGILKSDKQMSIEEAANQQFKKEGKPAGWLRSPARFGGARALKIIGSSKKAPGLKMVQYYVEASDGYFLVQCMAPEEQWDRFKPLFAIMISHFAFTL